MMKPRYNRPVVFYTGVVVCLEARYAMSSENRMELLVTCLEPKGMGIGSKEPPRIQIVVPYDFEEEWFKLSRGACVGVVDVEIVSKQESCIHGRVTQSSVVTHNLLEDTFFGGNKKLASLFVNDRIVQHVRLVERYLHACARRDFEYAKYILAWFTVMEKAKLFEKEQGKDIDVGLFPDSESISTEPPSSGHEAIDGEVPAAGAIESSTTSPIHSPESVASPQLTQMETKTISQAPPPTSVAKHVRFELHEERKTTVPSASPPKRVTAHPTLPALRPCIRKYSRAGELTEVGLEIHDYLFPPVSGQDKTSLLL